MEVNKGGFNEKQIITDRLLYPKSSHRIGVKLNSNLNLALVLQQDRSKHNVEAFISENSRSTTLPSTAKNKLLLQTIENIITNVR